jgi:hypothetical protein
MTLPALERREFQAMFQLMISTTSGVICLLTL